MVSVTKMIGEIPRGIRGAFDMIPEPWKGLIKTSLWLYFLYLMAPEAMTEAGKQAGQALLELLRGLLQLAVTEGADKAKTVPAQAIDNLLKDLSVIWKLGGYRNIP